MTQDLLAETTAPEQPIFDPSKDYLPELVGEGKKFKSQEDLAKSKVQSDLFIDELKRELKETREYALQLKNDNQSKANLQELIDQLQSRQSDSTTPARDNPTSEQAPFDPKQIKDLVSSTVQEITTAEKQNQNFNMVMSKLQERYGSNYANVLKQQIDELGITREDINEMARKQPKVVIKTLGLDAAPRQDGFQAPPRSTDNRSSFAPTTQERTWTYYQNLRKTDPAAYFTTKIQDQLHRDHMSLGSKFEDGDWSATY